MPASELVLRQLAARYQLTLAALADRTATQVGTTWDRVGGIDDTAQARFATAAARTVEASQRAAAQLADAYIRGYVGLQTDRPQRSALDLATIIDLRGVPALDVYRRPTITARTALARGRDFTAAFTEARTRATTTADLDVKLAARRAADDAMAAADVTHWRRVPDGTACTFCLTASTQRYRVGDLMPLHTRCGCTIAPLAAGDDRVIDKALLGRLEAATGRPDYWNDPKAAIAVRTHGELGPVLVAKNHNFDGPGLAA